MRILLINNHHYPKGGAEKVYLNTAELLEKEGHEVFFYSKLGKETVFDKNSSHFPLSIDIRKQSVISKIKLVKRFIYNNEAYNKIKKYLKIINPDIAHVHLFMGGLTISVLKAIKEEKIPVVHTVHDYRLICPAYLFIDGKNKICQRCKKIKYYNCLLHRCSDKNLSQSFSLALDSYFRYFITPDNLIDKYIFVSNFSKQKHIEFGYGQPNKFHVLNNFMPDLDDIAPNNTCGDYFIYFGRLSREKGLLTLVNAFKKNKFKLKIVGEGPLRYNIDLEKTSNIDVLGYKTGKELNQLIRNSSFVIAPSECYENNPLSIIEGYAHGKPVIGANIGAIPEILSDGTTGFLFETSNVQSLNQKINLAMELSKADYKKMSNNARVFANENFHPDIHLSSLTGIYKQLTDS